MDEDAIGIVDIFSFYGRIGRLRYLAYTFSSLFIGLLLFSILFAILYFLVPPDIGVVAAGIIFLLLSIAVLFFNIMFSAQRCHDVNLPAWAAIVIFIPFGQVFLFLMPGSEGDNDYGSQPMPNSRGVYISLVIIPVVIIMVGILSAVALPAYQTFLHQANNIKSLQPNLIPAPVKRKAPVPIQARPPATVPESKKSGLIPAPKPASVQPAKPVAKPEKMSKPEIMSKRVQNAPAVPQSNLKGLLVSRAFTPDMASINKGVLEIRQGEGVFADLKITIFTGLTPPYSGKSLKITTAAGVDSPHIHISYLKDNTSVVPDTEIIKKDYYMYLEFGEEKNSSIPVKLLLKTVIDTWINIAGRMQTRISELETVTVRQHDTTSKRVTSKIDTSLDNLDTIKHVGNDYVRQQFPDKPVNFNKTKWLKMENALGVTAKGSESKIFKQHAEYAAEFSVDGAKESRLFKLQLEKMADGWRVINKLDNKLIFSAHPHEEKDWLKEPGIKGPKVLTAKHFELNKYQQYSWRIISEPDIQCGQNPDIGLSICEVRYNIQSNATNECNIDTYIFDMKYEQWRLKQILPTTKQFMLENGDVVERKLSNMMCF